MQISVENIGKLERKIHVAIPEQEVRNEIGDRLKAIAKTTRIQGFRLGKAPLPLIKSRYEKQIRQEVVGDTIRKTLYEALTQKNLRPVNTPQISTINDQHGSDLSYTASLEIYPDIELASLDKIEIEKPVFNISEEDIDKAVELLRKQHRQFDVVERASAAGDVLNINFEGKIDGQPFAGGSAKDYNIELGELGAIEGFTEALIGKTANEHAHLTRTFPSTHHDKALAGKTAHFEVQINTVNVPRLPEVDAAFFEKLGIKEGGQAAFRAAVRENITHSATQATNSRLKESVLSALLAANPITLPQSMVNQEQERIKAQQQAARQQIKDTQEKTDPVAADALQKEARRQVALQLILADIIGKNKIEADAAKVRTIVERMATNYQDPAAFTNWYYSDKKKIAEIEALVLEEGAINWVVAHAKIKEKNYSFDELMK